MSEPNTNIDRIHNSLNHLTTDEVNQLIDERFEYQQVQLNEHEQYIEWLITKVQQLEHLARRNQELEFRENPYSSDGNANCNS